MNIFLHFVRVQDIGTCNVDNVVSNIMSLMLVFMSKFSIFVTSSMCNYTFGSVIKAKCNYYRDIEAKGSLFLNVFKWANYYYINH